MKFLLNYKIVKKFKMTNLILILKIFIDLVTKLKID